MKKTVMTVTGPIDPDDVGVTLMHEHLAIDLKVYFEENGSAPELADAPVTMDVLHKLRRRPFSTTRQNLVLDDVDLIAKEVRLFANAGGSTICEMSTVDMGRKPEVLKQIAESTGVNVVMSTGFYIDPSHPEWVHSKSIDQVAEYFLQDLREGVDGTGIRAGIIGEIGTSAVAGSDGAEQVTPSEEKVLRAAARAGIESGAAVAVHLAITGFGAHRVLDILAEEGLPPERIVMAHMDTFEDFDHHLSVADRGVYMEFDCLGREYWTEELGHRPWGHDAWRVRYLTDLVERGFSDRLLLAQDVALKMDLCEYGGVGYAHVPTVIVPMLQRAGVSESAISRMLVGNPRDVLSINSA